MAFPRLVRAPDPTDAALFERSDDELMALARAVLRDAFAVLVERHALRVAGACARLVNDAERGRELAQDVWLLAWQARDRYQEGGFLVWLITIARNRCRNEIRRGKAAPVDARSEVPEVSGSSPGQLDRLLVEERRRRVRRALDELSTQQREALLLRFGEGLRYDEMTTVAGTGESTLRSRVHHGLRALKQKLEDAS
jgi:RNA polymerase sigma-70 factor (ECF subfamily)